MSRHFHMGIISKSAVRLSTVKDARKFALQVLSWNKYFPHSNGFANTFQVGLNFDYREMPASVYHKLWKALVSLNLEEFNVAVTLGLSYSWTDIAGLIPSGIKRLRLTSCALDVSVNVPQISYMNSSVP